MPENPLSYQTNLFRRRPVIVVTLILLVQIAVFYTVSTSEYLPETPALKAFPERIGPWQSVRETEVETEVQELLRADAILNREYAGPAGILNLFVAFFRSQRTGVTPHSPKVCLPGAGWVPDSSRIISVSVPGGDAIPVNRYTVKHGENRSLVLYWYQSSHRAVASEYASKFYLIADSLRYRRSDTALVRVIIPLSPQTDAETSAIQFIQTAYSPLKRQMGF